MNDAETKTLFVDRFQPSFSGIEILMIQHLVIEKVSRNGLSDSAQSILRDIFLELSEIIINNKICGPTDCFNIF